MSNKYLDLDGVKYLISKLQSGSLSTYETVNINLTTEDGGVDSIYTKVKIMIDGTPFEYNYDNKPLIIKVPAGAKYKIDLQPFEYYYKPIDWNEYTGFAGFSRSLSYTYKYAGVGCHFLNKNLEIIEYDERLLDEIVGIVILNGETNNVVVPLFYYKELYDWYEYNGDGVWIGDKHYDKITNYYSSGSDPNKYYLTGAISDNDEGTLADLNSLEGAYVVDFDTISANSSRAEAAMQDLFGKQNTDVWLNRWPNSQILNFCKYGFKTLRNLNPDQNWWVMTFRDVTMVALNNDSILNMIDRTSGYFSRFIISNEYIFDTYVCSSTTVKKNNQYQRAAHHTDDLNQQSSIPDYIFSLPFNSRNYPTSPTTYYNVTKSVPRV